MQPDRSSGAAGADRPAAAAGSPLSGGPPHAGDSPPSTGSPRAGDSPPSAEPAAGSPPAGRRGRRWPLALALLAILAASLAVAVAPVWIMQPFKPQTAAGMAAAHAIQRFEPLLSDLALIAIAALAVRLGRVTRWPGRTALVVALLAAFATAWLARQNAFERFFPPLHHPGYVPAAAAASFVAPGDPVLAIQLDGEEVAYPIRQVAFHHVVEDVVGDTPLIVTY
jgi:Protein of unknown function (DUF3179)